MAYTWQDGELVTAAKLNNYGSGLEEIKEDCEDAQGACEDAQEACEAATVHQPIVQNGTWWTWNQATSAYSDTGVPATGQTTAVVTYQEGTSGTVAPTGSWSSTVPTVAQGNYLWTKTVFNELYTTYSVARQGVDGTGAVISVNGASGVVVLDTDDISDSGCTNKWATQTVLDNSHNHNNKNFLDGLSQSTLDAKADKSDLGTISLSATWTGSASPYTQTVTVVGATVTANSKVDIQPSATMLAQLIDDGCNAMYIENNNGTLTVYAIGEKPTVALSNVQVLVTEVAL